MYVRVCVRVCESVSVSVLVCVCVSLCVCDRSSLGVEVNSSRPSHVNCSTQGSALARVCLIVHSSFLFFVFPSRLVRHF